MPTSRAKENSVSFRPGYEAIREQHVELRLKDVLTEKYTLALTSEGDPFDTACWSYDRPAETHIITFGQKITEHLKAGVEHSLPEYAKSYYRHEVAHSLWTVRDLASISKKLSAASIDFSLFNLLEDARIESRWRKQFGGSFNWLGHEEPLVPSERLKDGRPGPSQAVSPQWAMDVLTTIIQNEGDHRIRSDGGILADTPEADPVWEFYGKLCSATDHDEAAMVSLAQQWITEFGKPPSTPNGSSRASAMDMHTGSKVQQDPVLAGSLSARARGEEDPGHGAKGYAVGSARRGNVLLPTPKHTVDMQRAAKLERIIAEAFRFGETRTKEEAPSKRLSIRDVILKRPECFIHSHKARELSARVFLLIDTSGSMAGGPADSGRHIALALATLARKGKIEGHLAATQCRDSKAYHEVMPLRDFTESIAKRLPSDGEAEGIASAIRGCAKYIHEADVFICYTDGNITDASITKAERSIWHSKGVYTFGAYVGDADRADRLKEHFDYALCRDNERSLAIALATMIRRYSITRKRVRRNLVSSVTRISPIDTVEPDLSEPSTLSP